MPQRSAIDKYSHPFPRTMPDANAGLPIPPSITTLPSLGEDINKNGLVIIHNNQIIITPPLPGGRPAVISSVHPVVLSINRKTVTDPTEVTPGDQITWEISEKPQYQITVSEDLLKAYFTLYRAEKYAWKLISTPAAAEVTVRAEPDFCQLLSVLTVDQIIAGFKKSYIMRNLNIPALYAELNNPTYLPVCIAEGKAPVPGKNSRLALLFREDRRQEFYPAAESAEAGIPQGCPRVPFVREGEVIARRLPAEEGIPGFDVYGRILPSPPAQDLELFTGNCAVLQHDGGVAALRRGRPRIRDGEFNSKRIDFPDSYQVPEENSPENRIIMFPGDIVSARSVGSGTIIEALGNVYIYGDVTQATISATGSIFVQGKITGSQLYSGCFGARHNRLCTYSCLLMQEISGLREAARQLELKVLARQHTVKYGLVIMLLLESKYDHLPGLLNDLQEIINKVDSSFPVDADAIQHMLDLFLNPGQFTDDFSDAVLASFLKVLKSLHEAIDGMKETNVRIDMARSQDSIIKSGGDLHVHKEGIWHSELFSSGDVSFAMNEGACISSTVEAAGSITAQTVGKNFSERCVLIAGCKITVRQICNSEVTIGEETALIDGPAEDMELTAQSLRMRNRAH